MEAIEARYLTDEKITTSDEHVSEDVDRKFKQVSMNSATWTVGVLFNLKELNRTKVDEKKQNDEQHIDNMLHNVVLI